jgi:hypothetical protein
MAAPLHRRPRGPEDADLLGPSVALAVVLAIGAGFCLHGMQQLLPMLARVVRLPVWTW